MPTFKGNFKSIIDMGSLVGSDGKIPKEIQVLPYGNYNTMPYGPMAIDNSVFSQMVANFDDKVRKAVPIDVDHDGGKAAGWVKSLINKGTDGLWATVEWTKLGKELLSEKIYKLFSPEWNFDYTDPQHSTSHGSVLIAGSLTNRPLFKDLKALVASEDGNKDLTNESNIAIILLDKDNKSGSESNTMKIKDILKKKPADRSAEEKAFLKANLSKMDKDQKASYEADNKKADEDAKAEADKKTADDKKAKEEADAKKASEDKKAKEGETATIKASELVELKKAKEELDSMKAKEAVDKIVSPMIANEEGGKILPKAKKEVSEFLMTCSEAQKESFVSLMASMPDIKVVGQKSDKDSTSGMSAADQLDAQAVELMKANEGMKKFEALKQVNKDPKNKELVN